MSWRELLGDQDFLTFQTNAALLAERVAARFDHREAGREILEAIRRVPRHCFVGESYRSLAYTDEAIPTIDGLSTSAPSVIAEMIFLAGVRPGDRAIEVGTGTGYQAAVLAEMGVRVHSIEINEELAVQANQALVALGYKHDKTATGPRGAASLARYHKISREFRYRGIVDLYFGNGFGGLARPRTISCHHRVGRGRPSRPPRQADSPARTRPRAARCSDRESGGSGASGGGKPWGENRGFTGAVGYGSFRHGGAIAE